MDECSGQFTKWMLMQLSRNFSCATCLSEFAQGWIRDLKPSVIPSLMEPIVTSGMTLIKPYGWHTCKDSLDTTYLYNGMILSTLGLSPHGFVLGLYPKRPHNQWRYLSILIYPWFFPLLINVGLCSYTQQHTLAHIYKWIPHLRDLRARMLWIASKCW